MLEYINIMDYENYSTTPDQSVMWDFRQFYVDWVRYYIQNFAIAHLKGDYPKMYNILSKWHSIIWGRSIKEFNKQNNSDTTFNEIINSINSLSNDKRYHNTYLLKEKNPEAVAKIDESFEVAITYLVWLMKKNKLFGTESTNRSLT